MKSGSLRLRLIAAAGLSILVALVFIGGLLVWVFERHVRDRMAADLGHQLNQLAALAVPAPGNTLKVEGEMTDPRFDQPLGGLYWQIDRGAQPEARSRSLWDVTLVLPDYQQQTDKPLVLTLAGPGNGKLLAVSRLVRLAGVPSDDATQLFRLTVAADLIELDAGRKGLIKTLFAGLAIAFVGLMLAAWAQVKFGLKPLEAIRKEIASVRTGQTDSLQTSQFPAEVLPLADEINRFLSNQKRTIERARWRASDLAHGLKTPLATMSALADELLRSGNGQQSANLKAGIDAMQNHIERQLAIARSQGGANAVTSVTPRVGNSISNMMDVLRKLPRQHPIEWSASGDLDATAQIEVEDLDEILGNLLDNAGKWAKSSVVARVSSEGGGVRFTISDDGPGIPDENLGVALKRGIRLDERVQGSGLGLSIVQSILETYGTELQLSRSEAGGLKAEFFIAGDGSP